MSLRDDVERLLVRYKRYAGEMLVDEEHTTGSIGEDAEMFVYCEVVEDLEKLLKKEQ